MTFRLLGVALLGAATIAQATPPADETVVVSASRSAELRIPTAADILVIDRNAITASGATSLAELLRGRPGIHIRDAFGDGSNASIDMRGFGSTASANTLVMIDGRKLNPASDSASLYLSSIDLDEVEQIEIIQGSAGILFGNQAVGGVINLITRRPAAREFNIGAGAGSFDAWTLHGRASERLDSGLGYRLAVSQYDSDNYRDHNTVRSSTLSAMLDWEQGDTRVFAEFDYLDESLDTPGALFLEEAAADPEQAPFSADFLDTRSRVTRFGIAAPVHERWRLEAELAYRNDDREFVQSFRTFPGSISTQARETWDFTPRLLARFPGTAGDAVLTLGFDYQTTDYLLVTAFGPQATDQQVGAFYAQWLQPLASDWQLIAGARHAWVDNDIDASGSRTQLDDDVTIGSLGLIYTPGPAWELRLRADQNYRFAKVDEHTNVVFGQPVGLDNQTGLTLEAGASWQDHGHRLSVLVYRLELEDEISFDASGFVNVNLDKTRRDGIQVAADSRLGHQLLLGGSYDWVDSEITTGPNAGNRIPLVPEHRGRAYLTWQPRQGLSSTLEVIAVDDQVYGSDFANRFAPLDGYTLLNLSALYEWRGLRFNARINNLLDASYSETGNIGSDTLGSGHDQCVSGAFSDSCPAVNPSPERNFWFSVSSRFGS